MLLLVQLVFFSFGAVRAQEIIELYPTGKIRFAKTGTEVPKLTVYRPSTPKTDIAVIVCSGGSYGGRANDWEGIPACKKLNEAGITAFLLDYRLPKAARMEHKELVPLTDAQKAILYLREHASDFKINPSKLGIMGFSAGGHLVTTVATHFGNTALENPKNTSLRPDFLIAVYPVVSFADSLTHIQSRKNLIGPEITPERIQEYSNELQVTSETPPTFLVSAIDDDVVIVQNTLYFEAALRQHRVPVQTFFYARGGHGFGVDHLKDMAVQWTEPCFKWLLSESWKK
ncbi:alpha/beta hydrolase [Niabella terrae]